MKEHDKKTFIGFSYAWNGLKHLLLTERNFKIQFVVALVMIGSGFILKFSQLEWILLFIVIGIVLIAESINSAIELIMDFLYPEIHPSVKRIKDVSAGAVLISAIMAIIVGIILIGPKILPWWKSL